MLFGLADNRDATTAFFYRVAFGDGVDRIVRSFGLYVRAKLTNQGADIEFGENDDRIDRSESRDDFGALGVGHNGPAGALQRSHRCIRIDGDNEFPAQFLGRAQIAHVADMQQVKISIGQYNALAGAPPKVDALAQFIALQDFSIVEVFQFAKTPDN